MDDAIIRCAGQAPSLPEYQTEGASGADIKAFLDEPVVLKPGERALVPTGLCLDIPKGLEAQVRPRSGLAVKHGITVLNSPRTIDSDYRGELKIILVNLGREDFTVHPGDRVAQLVVSPVVRATFLRAESVEATRRGGGGFGSTGM